jgi:tRNA(Leu) C34 or U34 (ribose-2'-O)-methylase TrmL
MKLVLVTPEIPYNTGAIGRTCVALDLELILIKPYGFSLDEKAVIRAGTRYWQHVQLSQYDSCQSFWVINGRHAKAYISSKNTGHRAFTHLTIARILIWFSAANPKACQLRS